MVGVVAIVGAAVGKLFATHVLRGTEASAAPSVLELVERTGRAVDRDDLEAVWDALAPETHEVFQRSHRQLLLNAEEVRRAAQAPGRGDLGRIVGERFQQFHGADAATLAHRDSRQIWLRYVRDRLGPPERRPRFSAAEIVSVKQAVGQVLIDSRLPDGRIQGYVVKHAGGSAELVDFQPYWPTDRWLRSQP